MADEDEIDILSEFDLDNILQESSAEIYDHSELSSHQSNVLNCDCSAPWSSNHAVHSFWDTTDQPDYNTELCHERLYNLPENVSTNVPMDIADYSGWTKMEKTLLGRGIEIFGKNSARLAQFVGSKTSQEVKSYLKNFYYESHTDDTVQKQQDIIGETKNVKRNGSSIILEDAQIPASIEEVIAVVSTATPTVPLGSFKNKKFETKFYKKGSNKFKHGSSSKLPLKTKLIKILDHRNDERAKGTFRTKNMKRPIKKLINLKRPNFVGKYKFKKKNESSYLHEAVSEVQMLKNDVNAIPSLHGEEVVKIKKEILQEESSSDIEVDVEDLNSDEKERGIGKTPSVELADSVKPEKTDDACLIQNSGWIDTNKAVSADDFKDVPDNILEQLVSLEVPNGEFFLEDRVVLDLEKYVNKEFFCGRPTKTPQRYLKIRNHILSMWLLCKPNYVTKTAARTGLKHCGDVNSISRIHQLLEQIGAINFGCTQLNYVRPLLDIFMERTQNLKERGITLPPPKPLLLGRSRIKKKFTNDGEGGCTLIHDEKGDVISTTVVNEEPVVKLKPYKKPSVKLIYCKSFTTQQPYNILLHLTPLLLMDFHAHISHTEVMGLIGGRWNEESKQLIITRYVPCRNMAPSTTHCDMCPISQAHAADVIHTEGLNILGWFHSHPTFAPEPSQQDIDTQLTVQQWIGICKPCIGLILSPFSAHGALISSPYRCLIVDKKNNFEDQYVPYKFKIELRSTNLDIDSLLGEAWLLYNRDCNVSNNDKVNFSRPYFLDSSISYLDKFILSVKMHLAKCADINKMSCDKITSGFSSICLNKT